MIKPLLGVVPSIAGECLMSFMVRAAAENVFTRVREMVRSSGIDIVRAEFLPFTGVSSAPILARLLNVDRAVIEGMMHLPARSDRPLDKVQWYGTCIPRRFIEIERRISPASFAASQHDRAIWQVRPITFCPESMEILTSSCLHCKAKLSWTLRRGFGLCGRCGGSLKRGRPGKVDWRLRREARWAAQLVDCDPTVRLLALKRLPSVFHEWEPGDAFVGAVELGVAFSFPDREAHKVVSKKAAAGDFSDFSIRQLVTGYRAMLKWPESLHEFLPAAVDDRRGDLHTRLGPFGKYFLHSTTYERPIARLVRDEVSRTLTRTDLIPFGDHLVRTHWMKRSDRLTRNEAGKEFGIEPRIVGRLSKTGHAVVRLGVKKKQVLYDPERLGPSVAIYKSSLSAQECAAQIGIPAYSVPALVSSGLIHVVSDHDALIMAGSPLYDEGSVVALKHSLQRLPVRSGEGQKLATCMERLFHPDTWADVINGLLRQEISVTFIPEAHRYPLSKVEVDRGDFNRFIAQMADRPIPIDITVASVVAGSLLGIPGDTVAQLVKLGLMQGSFDKRVGKIRLSDLAGFSKHYLLGGEGDFRSARRGFSMRMRAKGVEPVAVVRKQWIWLRERVEGTLPAEAG